MGLVALGPAAKAVSCAQLPAGEGGGGAGNAQAKQWLGLVSGYGGVVLVLVVHGGVRLCDIGHGSSPHLRRGAHRAPGPPQPAASPAHPAGPRRGSARPRHRPLQGA